MNEPGMSIPCSVIVVRNINEDTTFDELEQHFKQFGTINSIQFLYDKITGRSKNMAYIEFSEECSITNALSMDRTYLRNNLIYVSKQSKQGFPPFVAIKEKVYNNYTALEINNDYNCNIGPILIRKKFINKTKPY